MLLLATSVEETLRTGSGNVYDDIIVAADLAYDAIATKGMDKNTVCRLPICSEASSLIVKNLVDCGYVARQEVVVHDEVGQHSYPVIVNNGEELIVDSAWQQFLPKNRTEEKKNMPRVLIGSRGEVMRMARSFGLGESVLQVWEAQAESMSFEEHRLNDRIAEDEANIAADRGDWEKFMAA